MKQGLQLKSAQQLALTPQLQRSLKILQLSSAELQHSIDQELVENPLLEQADETTQQGRHEVLPSENQPDNESNWDQRPGARLQNSYTSTENPVEQTIASHDSLAQHLLWQVRLTSLRERDLTIAEHLLYCLDDDGYLNNSVAEVAELLPPELDAEADEVNAVLSLIKTLEPRGAGASDLQERLQIILAGLDPDTAGIEAAQHIVGEHIDLLAKHDFSRLKKKLALTDPELETAVALITAQNPRIGNRFFNDSKQHISADLLIQKLGSTWVAKLNPANQLKLSLNQDYAELLEHSDDPDSSEFLHKHLHNAKAFIKGLHSRYDTLLAVGNAIALEQQAFFEHGPEQLRSLTLKDIAEPLELHESTISRAVAGKYLLCNHGVLELKYFFPSAVGSDTGEGASATAIRSLIKQMVAEEPNHKPLSDNKIAQQLESRGHIVARRTVAKYRESLHIAPSSQRKRLVAN